jgi:small subunit ribosomal protein S27Ae
MAKKKAPKPKRPSKKYSLYQISGDKIERKNRSCPKCGAGIFLAKHNDRLVCGKCHYTEFVKSEKKAEEKSEKKPAEKKSEKK